MAAINRIPKFITLKKYLYSTKKKFVYYILIFSLYDLLFPIYIINFVKF